MKVHFSSLTDNWSTPLEIYGGFDDEFHFHFDPCPLGGGGIDGLVIEWGQRNFVNPPYSHLTLSPSGKPAGRKNEIPNLSFVGFVSIGIS